MSLRRALPLLLFLALAVLLGVGLTLDPREVPSPLVGRPAPAFALPLLEQPERRLRSEELLGEVTLLNVWASWCGGCRAEHPLLMELAAGGQVRLVGMDYKDERADALAWLGRHGNPYAATGWDGDGRVGIDYGVYGVPETYVIDRRGVIRHKHTGPLTEEVLRETLLPLIERLKHEPA